MGNERYKPQVIVAQLGARRQYAVPVVLHRAGMLAHFYTDAYVGPGSAWHLLARLAPRLPSAWQPQGLKKLLGRRTDGLPGEKVTAFNFLGFQYAQALAKAVDFKEITQIHQNHGDRFCQMVLQHHAFKGDAVYGLQGAALPLFRNAKLRGWQCLFEQFSAPAAILYQLYREEHDRWPDWEVNASVSPLLQTQIASYERATWNKADRIFCASEFVRQGLISQGTAAAKIQVLPYGVDINRFSVPRQTWDGGRPLRLLFLGGVTVRKGVQYLYEALRLLNDLRLEARLVGRVSVSSGVQKKLMQVCDLTGQVSWAEVHRHYQWADLFVFPSLCEGSAMVTYEALAAGLPVITTPNAGSVIRDGVEGFLVPIRNATAIAEKINLLAQDAKTLTWMSQNARKRAHDFSWDKYKRRLVNSIMSCSA